MKYAFIQSGKCEASLVKQCEWLSISTSGYYDWQNRLSKPTKRHERQKAIDEAVRVAFDNQKQRYGSPRLHVDLNNSGFAVALNTVADSMHRQSLVAKAGRKFKATTNSNHKLPVSPNLLNQDFTCSRMNEKWAGDITYTASMSGIECSGCKKKIIASLAKLEGVKTIRVSKTKKKGFHQLTVVSNGPAISKEQATAAIKHAEHYKIVSWNSKG